METILTVVHLFLAIGLVGLVLMQHGKGADAGAAFGSGASATVFGSQGSANFLSRATAILATLFFATSLWLAYYSMQSTTSVSLMENVEAPAVTVPAEPAVETESATDLPSVPMAAPEATNESDIPVVGMPAAMEAANDAAESAQAEAADIPAVVEEAAEAAPAADMPKVAE